MDVQDKISAEYKAAKEEFETAECALARARHRLHLANDAMRKAWNERLKAAESRLGNH